MTWWLAVAHAAPCPATREALQAQAERIPVLLAEDLGAVLRARPAEEALVADLACAGDVLDPADAIDVLVARGLVLFYAGEGDRAARYFAAVKALDPAATPPEALAPHDRHPLAVSWAAASWDGSTVDVRAARINGASASVAPATVPYLLQEVGPEGAVRRTVVVEPWLPAIPPPRRPPVVGLGLLGAGVATAAVVGFDRRGLCTRPDADGDGYLDCPAPVVATFWSGVGLASVGAALAVAGLVGDDRDLAVTWAPYPGAWGAVVSVRR